MQDRPGCPGAPATRQCGRCPRRLWQRCVPNSQPTPAVRPIDKDPQKATRAEVKALAETMIKDHTALNEGLTALATSKGAQLSSVIAPKGADTVKDLEKYSGEEFDKHFLEAMKDGHEKSVKNFKDAAENAKDGEVKAFASKNLPTIEGHLEHIKRLQK